MNPLIFIISPSFSLEPAILRYNYPAIDGKSFQVAIPVQSLEFSTHISTLYNFVSYYFCFKLCFTKQYNRHVRKNDSINKICQEYLTSIDDTWLVLLFTSCTLNELPCTAESYHILGLSLIKNIRFHLTLLIITRLTYVTWHG